MIRCLSALIVSLLMVGTVQAVSVQNVSPTKANGTFIAGSGIPGNNFTVDTAATGESVALKARGRASGQALSIDTSGPINIYNLLPGSFGGNPWWNFDFQFSPGVNGEVADNYRLKIEIDRDSSSLMGNVLTIDLPIYDLIGDMTPLNSWQEVSGDGLFANPVGGAWSSDDVDFVYSQSWRMNFGFISGAGFDTGPGEYQINLAAFDGSGAPVATTSIIANVIPTPAAAVVGLGMFGLLAVRRPRRD